MPNHPSQLRTMHPTGCLCAPRCIRQVGLGVGLSVLTAIGVFVFVMSSPTTLSTTLALFPTTRQSHVHSAHIRGPSPGVGQRTARHLQRPAIWNIEAPARKLPQQANLQSFIDHSGTHVPWPGPWSFSLGLGLLLLLSAPVFLMRARFSGTVSRHRPSGVTGDYYNAVPRPRSMQQRAAHSGLCCAVRVHHLNAWAHDLNASAHHRNAWAHHLDTWVECLPFVVHVVVGMVCLVICDACGRGEGSFLQATMLCPDMMYVSPPTAAAEG